MALLRDLHQIAGLPGDGNLLCQDDSCCGHQSHDGKAAPHHD
jgi:hypothetical protein